MKKVVYPVQRYHNLLIVKAAIESSLSQPKIIRLLVDTGASYTLISSRVLTATGYTLESVPQKMMILAAGGQLEAVLIQLHWFNCLGNQLLDFPILAWDLPQGVNTSGLLGMDFLCRVGAVIDTNSGTIAVSSQAESST